MSLPALSPPSLVLRTAILAVAAALAVSCSRPSPRETGSRETGSSNETAVRPGETPQSVFQAAQEAAAAYRWKEFCSYLTPRHRDALAASLCVAGRMLQKMATMAEQAGDAKAVTQLSAHTEPILKVLQRHQVSFEAIDRLDPRLLAQREPPRELIEQIVAPVEDRNQFIADMMETLLRIPGQRPFLAFSGKMIELEIDGERATAVRLDRRAGQERREPLVFRKIDGEWRIELPPQP